MRMEEFVLENDEVNIDSLKMDLKKNDVPKDIKIELTSWFHSLIQKYVFDETKMFRSEYKRYFMAMLKASDFTAKYYKLPKFTAEFIKKNIPDFLLKEIEKRYGDDEQVFLIVVFFFLNELIDVSYLNGGEVWNFNLFKEMNGRINDDMKKIEKNKEEFKKEDYNEDI